MPYEKTPLQYRSYFGTLPEDFIVFSVGGDSWSSILPSISSTKIKKSASDPITGSISVEYARETTDFSTDKSLLGIDISSIYRELKVSSGDYSTEVIPATKLVENVSIRGKSPDGTEIELISNDPSVLEGFANNHISFKHWEGIYSDLMGGLSFIEKFYEFFNNKTAVINQIKEEKSLYSDQSVIFFL